MRLGCEDGKIKIADEDKEINEEDEESKKK